jgi:hypothetical protein
MGILLVRVMGKALRRAGEAGGQGHDGAARGRAGLALQRGVQDALDAVDIEQLEAQGARAGRVDPGATVALSQAEQFLSLPEPGPGKRPAELEADELA